MIYLASRSPRRLELLRQLGIECRLLLDEDESRAEALEAVLPGESPAAYVQRVARAKTQAALARLRRRGCRPRRCCAPTRPWHRRHHPRQAAGRRRCGADAAAAFRAHPPGADRGGGGSGGATELLAATQVSRVRFCRLKPAQVDAYIESGEPFGKAGAYAIQGLAAGFVRRIEGSHSGIMGLPLYETARLLRKAGYPMRSMTPRERRYPGQHDCAGTPGRRHAPGSAAGTASGSRSHPRPGRQHLRRRRHPGAARHAVGLHRHRPRTRRLPARRRPLAVAAATPASSRSRSTSTKASCCWCRC